MKFILALFVILAVSQSCNVINSDSDSVTKLEADHCAVNMDINGKPWKDYFVEDESEFSSSSMLSKWGGYTPKDKEEMKYDDLDDHLQINCTRKYNNHYWDFFRVEYRVPAGEIKGVVEHPEDYMYDSIHFSEFFTDYGVGRYSVLDANDNGGVRITTIDFDSMYIQGEIEVIFIVNESNREGNSPTYGQRRWPDTLHITNGEFKVGFQNVIEDGRDAWEDTGWIE